MLWDITRCAPRGHHIAYEPLPEFSAKLRTQFPQVEVREAAVSNRRGTEEFVYVESNPTYSGLKERNYPQGEQEQLKRITVPTEDLDSSLPEGYVPTLIKVDVEGAEQQVFEGAIGVLTKYRPIVVFEHGRGAAEYYGTRPSDIFGLLCDQAGLRIFDLDGGGPYGLSAFEDAYEGWSRWNFIARP